MQFPVPLLPIVLFVANRPRSWAKVNTRLESPLNAQLCVSTIVALLGLIYLGSSTAFNAMMSSAVYVVFLPY